MNRDRRREILWQAGIVLATLFVYVLPLRQAGFVWDDDMYVTSNATLRSLDGLRQIWLTPSTLPQYYPLVHTSFWLEYRLWGLGALGFHVTNAALHATAAVLLGRALRRLAVPGAWLGAALFALHPVQVESVAWITERKNVLSGVFYFVPAICLLRFFRLGEASDSRETSERPATGSLFYFLLGSLLFVCALLSKSVTASLPAAVLMVLIWKKGRAGRSEALFLVPLVLLGVGSGLATAWIERHHVGAEGEAWNLSIVERCLIAGRAVWFYASKLVWPSDLTFIYPRWTIDARSALQYVYPAGAFAVLGVLSKLRSRIGAGPLVAVLFYGGTLVPALGFFNVFPMRYSFVADHFQYHACAGLLALFAAAATVAAGQLPARIEWIQSAGIAIVLGILGALTWRQCGAYRNLESLWRDTLAKNPAAWMAHTNLGLLLVQAGKADEGILHYRDAIRLDPGLVEPRLNLGELLQREGRPDEAIVVLEELVSMQPGHPVARFNLGTALSKRGRLAEALPHFQRALRVKPDFAEAAYNLGTAYLRLGRSDDAEAMYREAIRIRPDYGLAHNNLAAVLESSGRVDEARAHRIDGLRLRAWALATHDDERSRNGAEAVRLAEEACRQSNWSDAWSLDALAAAYAETGRFEDAMRIGEQALAAARSAGQTQLGNEIAARVAGYRMRRPFRDASTIPRPGELPLGSGRRMR